MIKYEVLTYTLCDGWINCWSDGEENKSTFDTREAAQEEIDDVIAGMKVSYAEAEPPIDFDEAGEREQMAIVEEGAYYIAPELATLLRELKQ